MILLADDDFKGLLMRRVKNDPNPYSIRTASLYRAYGGTGLADFWVQEESGEPVSFLARAGGSMVLDLSVLSDTDEIAQFLAATAENTLYDGRFSVRPRQWREESGVTMRYTGARIYKPPGYPITNEPGFPALHNLLMDCASKDFVIPPFEDFYPDLSHKLRHGCAHAVGVLRGSALAAAALCLFRYQNCAVMGSVACAPPFRGQGYGSSAVFSLLKLLEKDGADKIFLHRARDKNEAFYQKLGFENCGTWKQCSRNP